MRNGLLVVAALLGAAVVLIVAATDDREVAFETGLPAVRTADAVTPGRQACRDRIEVPAAFSRIRLAVSTSGQPGPALRVAASGPGVEVAGRVAGGYGDGTVEAHVGPVDAGTRVRVCVHNEGSVPVALLGSPPDTPPDLLGDPTRRALPAFAFVREQPVSMLSLVPEAFQRAARFRPEWIGAWTFWLLLVAAAVAVPALLARALSSAYASERSYSARGDSAGASERSS